MRNRQPLHVQVPESLPVLQRGSHVHPDDGACFMEFASVLAGERFSDRPKSTHPVLAAVARAVNDAVSDRTRQRLLPLVPSVVGTPRHDTQLGPLLVAICTERALAVQEQHRTCFASGCGNSRCAHRQWLRSAGARARRRLGSPRYRGSSGPPAWLLSAYDGVRGRLYDASAEHVISLAVCVVARCDESAAVRLLGECIAAARTPYTDRVRTPLPAPV